MKYYSFNELSVLLNLAHRAKETERLIVSLEFQKIIPRLIEEGLLEKPLSNRNVPVVSFTLKGKEFVNRIINFANSEV